MSGQKEPKAGDPPKTKRKRAQKFEGRKVDSNQQAITGSGFTAAGPLKQGEVVTLAVRARVAKVSHGHVEKIGFVRGHTLKVIEIADLDETLAAKIDELIDDRIAERERAAWEAAQNIPDGQMALPAGESDNLPDIIDAEVVE